MSRRVLQRAFFPITTRQLPSTMSIVPTYAALLALLFVALSIRTVRLRRRLRIAIGDAGDPALLRAMRVHSNFAEYAPLSVILLSFVELRNTPAALVHGLCLCLLIGRSLHALGVSRTNEDYRFRIAGMALTFMTLIVSSAYLLIAFARSHGAF
jgi:uncharacterized membrane protein YecN with MAPEG domain